MATKKLSNRAFKFLRQANKNYFGKISVIKGFKTYSNPWKKYAGHYGGAELRTAEWMVKQGLLKKVDSQRHRHSRFGGFSDLYTEYTFEITTKGVELFESLGSTAS